VTKDDITTMTLASYAQVWMRSRIDLAERTMELYRWLLDRHIEPTFGNETLGEISPADVRSWYAEAAREHPTTAAKAYRLFSSIMRSGTVENRSDDTPTQ
jgi:hypothetical protein